MAQTLYLVWPERLPRRSRLAGFYLDLVAHLPHGQAVTFVLKKPQLRERVAERLSLANPNLAYAFVSLPTVNDIWIRDWAPAIMRDQRGRAFLVKAQYRPRDVASELSRPDHQAGMALGRLLKLPVRRLPLVLDFGNFEHNGRGVAIVSYRVFGDNPGKDARWIRRLFREKLGIEHLVFVPVEPGDDTGHVDGATRFLGPTILAVAACPKSYPDGYEYYEYLAAYLHDELGPSTEIVRIPAPVPSAESKQGVASAIGCYLNFVQVNGTFYIPAYGGKYARHDRNALRAFEEAGLRGKIVQVRSKTLAELAHLGGVINCVSWVT